MQERLAGRLVHLGDFVSVGVLRRLDGDGGLLLVGAAPAHSENGDAYGDGAAGYCKSAYCACI